MKKHLIILILSSSTYFAFAQSTSEELILNKRFQKQLKANEGHTYTLDMDKNSTLELYVKEISVDLVVDVFDADKMKLQTFDSDYAPGNLEHVTFTAPIRGKFFFTIYPMINAEGIPDSIVTLRKERNQGKYEIISASYYSEKEYAQKLEEIKVVKKKTINWIKQNAIPLKNVAAESGLDDLMPLKKILKDIQIVGLGEATHGAKEFFQMKHKMVEFLVKEMGFTVFALEAGYAGCANINDYVLYGKEDARTALTSQGYYTWDTEEFLAMIEWMHKYNTTVSDEKKVKFVGIDLLFNVLGGSFEKIKNYLKKVDPKSANENDSLLSLVGQMDSFKLQGLNTDSCKNEFLKFIALFSLNKGDYVQKSSEAEYDEVFDRIKILGQEVIGVNLINNKKIHESEQFRDYYMASNFKELANSGTKIIVWGHNMHIIKDKVFQGRDSLKMLGNYLKETYRDKYFSFGFSLSKGNFQARIFSQESKSFNLSECTVDAAKENTLDWYLTQTGIDRFIIPFTKPLPDYIDKFIHQKIETNNFSAQFRKEYINSQKVSIIISKSYDAIIFIDNTTRANPLFTK